MTTQTLFNGQVPAAGTHNGTPFDGFGRVSGVSITYRFTAGSGGTSDTAYVQTSLDGGVTWWDIACRQFETSDENRYQACIMDGVSTPVALTDGALSINTVVHGLLGDRFRVKQVVVGPYSGGALVVDIAPKS